MKVKTVCEALSIVLAMCCAVTACSQSTTNTYAQAVLADNPVVYYQFEESSGDVTAVDASGHGNNGAYSGVSLGGPGAFGESGYAVGFSGSSSSLVGVPPLGDSYEFGGVGNDQVTIEAWINPEQLAGFNSIYTVDAWVPDIVHFLVGSNSITLTVANNSPQDVAFPTGSEIQKGQWAYVAVVYDDTVPSAVLYINGEPMGTNYYATANPMALDQASIGIQADGGDPAYTGLIDEFAVYTNALSANRIQAHYLAAIASGPSVHVAITNQPQDASVYAGGAATFAVGAEVVGTANEVLLNYQWRSNGVDMVGATNASYTTPVLAIGGGGAYYSCVVSSADALSATTRDAKLYVVAAGTSYAGAVEGDHPVVYYRFDESAGATVAVDSSGNGNDGSYNHVSLGNPGAYGGLGYAAGFSGTADSLVSVPALGEATSLGGAGNNQVTIETWIKPQSLPGTDTYLGNSIYTINNWVNGIVHLLVVGTGTSVFFTVAGADPQNVTFPSTADVAVGQWAYVAMVYDGGSATLYINGEAVGTNVYSSSLPLSLDAGAIGVQVDGGDPAYAGLVDEFAIYTNALSSDELQAHYAAGMVSGPPVYVVITNQPQNANVFLGEAATFITSATVIGASNDFVLNYQWQTNGVNIAEATNRIYTTPSLSLIDNGMLFHCVVTAQGTIPAITENAILTVSPYTSYQDVVLVDHPVAYYRFEELSGAIVAADSSGNANNGSYTGVSLGNSSAFKGLGYAVGFSGTADSLVAVPALGNATSLGGAGNNQFTIEAWIKPAQLSGADSIYTVNQWNTGVVHFLVNGSSIRFTVATPPYDVNFPANLEIAVGQWTYVAVVYDAVAATAILYINGEPIGTNVYTTTVPVSLDNASIGVQTDGGDPAYTGLIDELAIYTNALSADRIQEHYIAAQIQPLPPVLSVEKFDDRVSISWDRVGFILQVTTNLQNNTDWKDMLSATSSPVTLPKVGIPKFYRLRRISD